MNKITDDAWLLGLGAVNAVLLRYMGQLTLIDTGFPGKAAVILKAIEDLGHQPSDLKHVVFTHAHPDHIGSGAAIVRATGAATWMHPLDTPLAESGGPFRPLTPSRGLLQHILYGLFWRPNDVIEPIHIDNAIEENAELPVAGGLKVIHTPGHSAGQVSLLSERLSLLIVADAATNVFRLRDPLGYENEAALHQSQTKLTKFEYDRAAFGHGFVMKTNAALRMRKRFGKQ